MRIQSTARTIFVAARSTRRKHNTPHTFSEQFRVHVAQVDPNAVSYITQCLLDARETARSLWNLDSEDTDHFEVDWSIYAWDTFAHSVYMTMQMYDGWGAIGNVQHGHNRIIDNDDDDACGSGMDVIRAMIPCTIDECVRPRMRCNPL